MLDNGSPFQSVHRLIFKRLKIVLHAPEDTQSLYDFDYQLKLVTFEIWNIHDAILLRFFQCFGLYLNEIAIEYDSDNYNGAMPMFANAYKFVLDHCEQEDATINLNGLSLHLFEDAGPIVATRMNHILDKVRASLQRLGLYGTFPGPDYSHNFNNAIRNLGNVTYLSFGQSTSMGYGPIWQLLGKNLKTIILRLPGDVPLPIWNGIINRIVQHCPKAEKIYFGRDLPPPVDHTSYRNMLLHYGKQLIRVPYTHLSIDDLYLFLTECPNNLCSWPQTNNRDIERFKILRPILAKVTLDNTMILNPRETGILAGCLKLEWLEISFSSAYGVKYLFGRSIVTRLKVLHLYGCAKAEEVVEIVVKHTPELETLDVKTTDVFPHPDIFQPIADSLRYMKYIRICEYDDDVRTNLNLATPCDRYIDMSIGIIDTFTQANSLRLFTIGTRSIGCNRRIFKGMIYYF